jgi:type I restriction enzyme R subunit
MYEPAMRHLIDTYIHAGESEKVSSFDDMSLVQLIVERGADAVKALPEGIRKNKEAVAEAIENNVRRLIIDEQPINPKYYEKMSELLDALINQRRQEALDYQAYLAKIVELTRKVKNPEVGGNYPSAMNTPGKRALYDNLGNDEAVALVIHDAVRSSRQDDWRSNPFKVKKVRNAIRAALESTGAQAQDSLYPDKVGVARDPSPGYGKELAELPEERVERILMLVKNQDEY